MKWKEYSNESLEAIYMYHVDQQECGQQTYHSSKESMSRGEERERGKEGGAGRERVRVELVNTTQC